MEVANWVAMNEIEKDRVWDRIEADGFGRAHKMQAKNDMNSLSSRHAADPYAPFGPRWHVDRGAMPGEPFAFLDGDEQSAVAAIFEIHSDGNVHFELHDSAGEELANSEDPYFLAEFAQAHFSDGMRPKPT